MASNRSKGLTKAGTERKKVGAPSDYRSEYCEMLIEHMGANGDLLALPFNSFAAVVGCTVSTLYDWKKAYPEFAEAHKRGLAVAEKAIALNLYKMAKGQFFVTYEKTFIDKNSGQPFTEVVTEPAKTNAAALIFLAKNVIGWKDRREVSLLGDDDKPITMRVESHQQKIERIEQLRRARYELDKHDAQYERIESKEEEDGRATQRRLNPPGN